MIEIIRQIKDRLTKKGKDGVSVTKGKENIINTLIDNSRGAHSIRMVVTPRVGSPLFEALPKILEGLDPNATAQIIFAIPKDYKPDSDIQGMLEKVKAITELNKRREQNVIADNDADLGQLDLQLQGRPDSNNLAVFIQDPQNKEQYWYRRIGIGTGSAKVDGMEKETPYVDIILHDMGDFQRTPCSTNMLDTAVKMMKTLEADATKSDDAKVKETLAVVGVARYTGQKEMSVDRILQLAAIKFSKMQTNTASNQN
jgi:hypothetical protein